MDKWFFFDHKNKGFESEFHLSIICPFVQTWTNGILNGVAPLSRKPASSPCTTVMVQPREIIHHIR